MSKTSIIERLKNKWPLVWKKTYDAEWLRHFNMVKSMRAESKRQEKEWEDKWMPFMQKMIKLGIRPNESFNVFQVQISLDRQAMELAAQLNDKAYWQYLAKMAAVHLERELATMNFSGLYKMASDYEDRRHRRSMLPFPQDML